MRPRRRPKAQLQAAPRAFSSSMSRNLGNVKVKRTQIVIASLGAAAALAAFPYAAFAQSNVTVTYTYDAQGRIATETYSNGVVVTYIYDSAGNLLSRAVTGGRVVILPPGFILVIP